VKKKLVRILKNKILPLSAGILSLPGEAPVRGAVDDESTDTFLVGSCELKNTHDYQRQSVTSERLGCG
jgi:hypothetical protein